ncbi:MAG: CehA/McbA family metallohydrolase [Pirellulales bacterium]|nr:CehA/McbA family metallohydrolase [Pirellulales bacterium]
MMKTFCAICFGVFVVVSSSVCAQQRTVSVQIVDADTGKPIPARLYLRDQSGQHYFFQSSSELGSAVRYQKQNWINKRSIEYHTTVSAHPSQATVPPGKYTLTVQRGKSYHTWTQVFEVDEADVMIPVRLKRWVNMAARGWYSGDTHIHRTLGELPNVVLAEDLNVVFPLTNWVTLSDTPPSAGNKNLQGDIPRELISVDATHVIWPRSTEYEIFSVAGKRHTLGALFVLGHQDALEQTVPPWAPVIEAARQADPEVLFDMDKLAWPFAMLLPTLAPNATYELANNHMWRTEFAFRDWYTPTPPYMQPPFGGKQGGEREWIDFTLGMYYTLLNCGFRMPASAGTANGVHPVPAGFGRVYVHLPDGFDYRSWRRGLQQGRCFVTTGPMLFATAGDHDPGHVFQFRSDTASEQPIQVHAEVLSAHPLSFGELVINGRPEHLLRVQNQKTESGAYRSVINHSLVPSRSGWFALRFWEDHGGGRVRFAHTAPWYIEVDGEPAKPRLEEKEYLVGRMRDEIQRSRGIVSPAGIEEYQQALETYRALPTWDDSDEVQRNARPLADSPQRQAWLENMILHHRFTAHEVRLATGLSIRAARQAVQRIRAKAATADSATASGLRVMPYPGGRHPRTGFLDGAIDPQRETKVSVFPPWKDGGYAVVDVPEAIFSNLGLTYLAHQHIPTIWTDASTELERLEWQRQPDGALAFERQLPNGISFGSRVFGFAGDAVAMEMWLHNGTEQPLTGLRSQVCVMMKGLVGFNTQRRRDQVVHEPFVAVRADDSDRWLITAWQPIRRCWTNPPVPCVHSDPVFPDCQPGKTVRVRGV